MTDLSDDEQLVNQGRVAVKEGKIKEAIGFFEEALKLNPRNDNALYQLGNIYNKKGNYDLAVEYLERALIPCEDCFRIWLTIADAYKMRQEYKKAIYAYKKALEFDPENEKKTMILSTIDNLVLKADYSKK